MSEHPNLTDLGAGEDDETSERLEFCRGQSTQKMRALLGIRNLVIPIHAKDVCWNGSFSRKHAFGSVHGSRIEGGRNYVPLFHARELFELLSARVYFLFVNLAHLAPRGFHLSYLPPCMTCFKGCPFDGHPREFVNRD